MNIVRILITVALVIATASGEWQGETSATSSSALPLTERTRRGAESNIKTPLIFVQADRTRTSSQHKRAKSLQPTVAISRGAHPRFLAHS